MPTKPSHTPTYHLPLGIREPFTPEEKRLNRIYITGQRTDEGKPVQDEPFDFAEIPFAPVDSPKYELAEYVVRAVNTHEELIKALSYYATGSTDGGKWAKQAIAKAEGK